MKYLNILFLLACNFLYCQTNNLSGVILTDKNIPLESANIIAKPLTEKATLKFAIGDNKGRYRLELETNAKYEITVSYIGYKEQILIVEANSDITSHDFKLESTGEVLKEIVIKHEYKPIVIKKDTLVYDVKAFTNGNERKLKEQLEKLPGVEVDKNGVVTVQGKKVTKFLVEGDSFFGGGTKLGVENIPANAVDKVEVIDHFNEVGFMKQVSDSEDLAMNIKLKEDKKRFVFGDVEAGAEIANDNGFHLAHVGLFYYSPKSNISFIGDVNNIGKSTFSFEDLMRFQGGVSSFLSDRKSFTNLYSFTNDNTDVVENKSQFSALNFSFSTSPKLSVSGFGIFSKTLMNYKSDSYNQYLQNATISYEDKSQNNNTKSTLGIGNIKLDYSPNKKEKWYYNGQYQSSANDINSLLNSVSNINNTTFKTLNNADNTSVKQYIEWHKNYSKKHTTTFVINQAFEQNRPTNDWFTDQPFLSGLIPIENDSSYRINQIKKVKNNSVDVLFKHYWTINNFNHLYTNIGNNFGNTRFETSERQFLSDGNTNDFAVSGFGNNVKYRLNDMYFGLEYKFKIGKWTNKPGLYYHFYNLKTNQNNENFTVRKALFQPQFNSDYEFNKSETLNFTYKLSNTFPEVSQLANGFTLQNYNSVFKGNALLQNEQFHTANLRYSKMNMYQGIMWNAIASYNKKVKTIRNEVSLSGINQFNTPILTDNPDTNWRFAGSVTKKIYRFNLKLNSSLGWFNYAQTVNNVNTSNDRTNQNVGLTFKTAFKKWPEVSVGYNKGFSKFSGLTQSKFQSDQVTADLELNIFKNFTFRFEYENLKNTNNNNQTNFYDTANTSLRYQKKNSAFGFELFANNLFNNKVKNDYSFSDFMVNQRSTFVLPRVVMVSISYKL